MKQTNRLRRALDALLGKQQTLSSVGSSRGWFTLFRSGDFETGSWQQDREFTPDEHTAYAPVYACLTQITSDVGKICLRLMQLTDGIWAEVTNPAYSPLLRKPNHFQTRQQFIETWVMSKLRRGNTYALKVRDNRNVVKALYILAPDRVTPLVAQDGSVFYQLQRDDLSKLPGDYPAVPASEIIHDRMECLFHPLVGISPLHAAALASSQGLHIQKNSDRFFRNMSRPGGMLTAPGTISDETAARLKAEFEKNFSGEKLGRLFVGGDSLEYKPMAQSAVDAQLVEQLKMSAEQVCAAFHVPAYMVGVGPLPTYDNVEALSQQYYGQCLQKLFNAIEDLLDDGLGLLASGYRTEFDLDDLWRMDAERRANVIEKLSKAGVLSPNEARAKFGYGKVAGGNSPYLQQQNYSLAALDKRDAQADPFGSTPSPSPAPAPADTTAQRSADVTDAALHLLFRKSPEELIHA